MAMIKVIELLLYPVRSAQTPPSEVTSPQKLSVVFPQVHVIIWDSRLRYLFR